MEKSYGKYILFENAYKKDTNQPDFILYDIDRHKRGGGWIKKCKNGSSYISIAFSKYFPQKDEDLKEALDDQIIEYLSNKDNYITTKCCNSGVDKLTIANSNIAMGYCCTNCKRPITNDEIIS